MWGREAEKRPKTAEYFKVYSRRAGIWLRFRFHNLGKTQKEWNVAKDNFKADDSPALREGVKFSVSMGKILL